MLPGRDGFSIASELRAQQNFVPILMLTARSRPEDVLEGFNAGADDYLAKPFDLSILLAHLNSLLRRMAWLRPGHAAAPQSPRGSNSPSIFTFAGRTIDFAKLELRTADKTIRLTLMEADLLRYLVANQGRDHLTQGVAGAGLAGSRGHGYAGDRQLHGPAAPLH